VIRSVILVGYFAAVENHQRKAESRTFKKYIEDIRLQEALDLQNDEDVSSNDDMEELC
jgi:hypothetical protein